MSYLTVLVLCLAPLLGGVSLASVTAQAESRSVPGATLLVETETGVEVDRHEDAHKSAKDRLAEELRRATETRDDPATEALERREEADEKIREDRERAERRYEEGRERADKKAKRREARRGRQGHREREEGPGSSRVQEQRATNRR